MLLESASALLHGNYISTIATSVRLLLSFYQAILADVLTYFV